MVARVILGLGAFLNAENQPLVASAVGATSVTRSTLFLFEPTLHGMHEPVKYYGG